MTGVLVGRKLHRMGPQKRLAGLAASAIMAQSPLATEVAMPVAAFRPSEGAEPISGYRLEAFLGRGGFGEVWRASAPGGFKVALKFLAADEAARELKSLQMLQRIRDGHLLGLHGVWAVPGFFVLAMELADRTLMDRLKECREQGLPGIPRDELLRYFEQARAGLDFLNEPRHVLAEGGAPTSLGHGDVKPQNLLLVGSACKVGDFGLLRRLSATASQKTCNLTPAYAPPEAFEGRPTVQSDQYSLAVSWCQLRGGRLPFVGDRVQVMAGHMRQPPDLSMLPEGERSAVRRALAKDPARRWPSCRAFVEALVAGRRRWGAWAAALLAVLATVGVVLASLRWSGRQPAAEDDYKQASKDAPKRDDPPPKDADAPKPDPGPKKGQPFTNSVGMKFAWIEPGSPGKTRSFLMGSPDGNSPPECRPKRSARTTRRRTT
jgi:serine/threonine protein kinase